MNSTIAGPDGKERCRWCAAVPEFLDYHDTEWGFPVVDDRRLFEKLCLEGFQSGLSWRTILVKRENFRAAFCGFDFNRIAEFGEREIEALLQDAGIVRHRGKIESAINNARRVLELRREFGSLAHYVWRYAPLAAQQRPERMTLPAVRAMTTSAVRSRRSACETVDSAVPVTSANSGNSSDSINEPPLRLRVAWPSRPSSMS